MNDYPFLTDSQIEELEYFGMMELTEEICDSMSEYFGAEDYPQDF